MDVWKKDGILFDHLRLVFLERISIIVLHPFLLSSMHTLDLGYYFTNKLKIVATTINYKSTPLLTQRMC